MEAEPPKKKFWANKKIIAGFLAVVLGGGLGWYGLAYGFGSLASAWRDTQSLAVKTFRDVLGSGGRAQLAAEVDLSGAGENSFFAGSSTVSVDAGTSADAPTNSIAFIEASMVPESAASAQSGSIVSAPSPEKKIKEYVSPESVPKNDPPVSNSNPVLSPAMFTAKNSEASITVPVCSFRAAADPIHRILLNEIAWMGSLARSGETAAQATNNEWIELRDNAGADVDLSGWQIVNQSEKFKITLDANERIRFGEFFLLERANDGSVPGIAADKIYSGTLSNSGEWLRLFDRDCRLIDEINASSGWPGGDNGTRKTLERDLVDLDWHTSGFPGGTPKAANSVVLGMIGALPSASPPPDASSSGRIVADSSPTSTDNSPADSTEASSTPPDDTWVSSSSEHSPSPAPENAPPVTEIPSPPPSSAGPTHPVIAALQITGAASTNDFIKILNPADGAIDVSGWKLRKRTSTGTEYSIRVFPAGSIVAPQHYFIWANSADGFAVSIGANVSSTETLASDNSVALENATGTIIDAVAWGSRGTDQFVEGAPYPDDPTANQILTRKFVSGVIQDIDNNAEDFAIQ